MIHSSSDYLSFQAESLACSLGIAPAALSYITGFSLRSDGTSSQFSKTAFGPDTIQDGQKTSPEAVSDMQKAYTDAMRRTATMSASDVLDGATLKAGV